MSKSKESKKAYEEKRKGTRFRNHNLIVYPDDVGEGWEEKLSQLSMKWACSPIHDKDVDENGNLKKRHFHLTLMFPNPVQCNTVYRDIAGIFGWSAVSPDSVAGIAKPIPCRDKDQSIRYFIHADNPEKAQYKKEDIRTFNGANIQDLWKGSETDKRNTLIEIIEFIDDNNIMEYCDLVKLSISKPDWFDVVTKTSNYMIGQYLASKRGKRTTEILTKSHNSTAPVDGAER